MPATASTRTTLRRGIVAAAALPLLIGALASCGYGSEAKKDEPKAAAADAGKKLSASEVRIGYFPNLTHATALVGLQEGLIEKELGGTKVKPQSFNAGPSEIEALNGGSLDIGFIGPSPSINGYVKSKGS
ncbi:ABC transporter substrate-binding protein, partial [Streptomyces virginiae]|uniref:ABC transporter substrate-binding protein n=1 Tax=Streptomyces virginiae TaxID=1961 RepID=UPI003715092C